MVRYPLVLTALAALLGGAGAAGSAGCLGWPLDARDSSAAQPIRRNNASSEVMPIDRRPALVHQAYLKMDQTADRDPRDGVPDAVNVMLEALDDAHAMGFGRMIINRPLPEKADPKGRPGVDPQPLFSTFADLSPSFRRAWRTHVRRWAESHPGFAVEVYIRLNTPPGADKWDPATYVGQLRPWLESGVRVAWLDAMIGDRNIRLVERINRLPHLVDEETGRRLVVGAEPIALDREAGEPLAETRVPFIAAQQFGGWNVIGAPSHRFDPDTTWINFWETRWKEDGGSAESLRFERMRANGYLPWVYHLPRHAPGHRQPARLRRVFGVGVIEDPADWNDDGTIDRADRALFLQRWDSGDAPTYFNGDYDRDGQITERDRIAFERGWRTAAGGVPPAPIDLGRLPPPTSWARQRAEIMSQRQAGSE